MASNIKGITVKIGGDTTELGRALKDSTTQSRALQSELKGVNTLLKYNPGNTVLLTQKHELLTKSIEQTKKKLDSLKETLAKADSGEVELTEKEYRDLQREIVNTENKLKSLNKEQASFGSVGAQKVAAVGEKFKDIGGKMAAAGTAMTTKFTAPVVAGAVASVNKFGEVDKQFSLVKETMGKAHNSAKDFEKLWNTMGDAAKNSVFGMKDAADAALNFARQGFNAREAANLLAPAMSLAAGTGTDLASVSGGLGNALKVFGANANEAGMYADVLAKAQAQANTTTTDLFAAIGEAGPIVKSVGWSIKDLATLTGMFGDKGISGSEGANALKTGLARLASPAKSGAEAMHKLGLETGQTHAIFNDDGSMKSMPEVLGNLQAAFKGLSPEQKLSAEAAIFGKEQMSKWDAVISTSPKHINELKEGLDKSSGSAERMSKALMGGTGGAIETLKSTFDVFATTLGQALAPALTAVMKQLTGVLNAFMKLSPGQQQVILGIIGIVAAIGPLLIFVGKVVGSIGTIMTMAPKLVTLGKTISGGIGVLGGGLNGLFGIIAANPVIAVIVAIIAALTLLYNHCKPFRDFVNGMISEILKWLKGLWAWMEPFFTQTIPNAFNALKAFIEPIIKAIGEIVTTVVKALGDVFNVVFNAIKTVVTVVFDVLKTILGVKFVILVNTIVPIINLLLTVFTTVFNGIKAVVETVIAAVKWTFENVLKPAIDFIQKAWEALGKATSEAWNAIKNAISTIINAIKDTITDVINKIKSTMENIWNAIKKTTSDVWNAISKAMSGPINTAKDVISGIIDRIKSVVTNVWNSIKNVTSSVFNGIKDITSSIWNAIYDKINGPINKAKSIVSGVVNGIKGTVEGVWNSIKRATESAWNAVSGAITGPINAARNTVSGIVGGIRSTVSRIFDGLRPRLPLSLPRIKVDGGTAPWGIAGKGRLPSFHIDWHALGAIFKRPTLFATETGYHGVGEAGPEAVAPIDTLQRYVHEATAPEAIIARMDRLEAAMAEGLNAIANHQHVIAVDGDKVVGATVDKMDEALADKQRLSLRGV